MFNFLNPIFLTLAAGAAALPILIHLLRRNKAVRIDFAAMRFLLGNTRPIVRWLRIKQFLILLMRIMAVVLLGLAFARPFFPGKTNLGILSDQDREIGIVLDVTASMHAAENARRAAAHLQDLLQGLKDGTLISVCLAGKSPRIIVEREPLKASLRQRVQLLAKPTFQAGQLREAVQAVDDLMRSSPTPRKELYLISDFQRSAWPEQAKLLDLRSGARLLPIAVAQKPWKNAGIVAASPPQQGKTDWQCAIYNYSPGELGRGTVRLIINGRAVASKAVRFGTEQTLQIEVRYAPRNAARQTGYFELLLEEDDYTPDNYYYFSAAGRPATKILAVNGEQARDDSDELFFVSRAFQVRGTPYELAVRSPNELKAADLDAFDIILLANVKGLNHNVLQALEQFVMAGGGLLIAPGDKITPRVFNRLFAGLVPGKLIARAHDRLNRSGGNILLLAQLEHSLIEKLAIVGGAAWSQSFIYQYWRSEPAEAASILAMFDDGNPAILEKTLGRGKVVMFTFPLDVEWSQLPVKPLFLPMLYTLAEYLPPRRGVEASWTVGQPIFLGKRFAAGTPITMNTPDGAEVTLQPEQQIFARTSSPGIYEARQGGISQQMAVNVVRTESETELLNEKQISAWVQSSSETVSLDLEQSRVTAAAARETESSQKLWRVVMLFVVVLLFAESFLANRTPR